MDSFFKISERGSTVSREVSGGLTTFLSMAYIIAVNPSILTAAGIPFNAALTATCFGAAIMTAVMGLCANRPLMLASGMGINSIVAFGLCAGNNAVNWRVAMAVVMVEGIAILVLVACGLRKAVMDAIPPNIRHAIGIGIGVFVAFIGLINGGIVVNSDSTLITLGNVTSPACIVAYFSIGCALLLQARKVPGALLISIILATIVGIPLGVTQLPTSWSFGLDFSAFAAPLQTDPDTGMIATLVVFTKPALLLAAFSLLMSDFFDTMGTVMAVADKAEFSDEEGNVEDIQPILMADSAAAIAGGFFGASSITTFVESVSGAAAGARTGLASLVTAAMFAIAAFLSPLFGMVSGSATCGALVIVGFLMMSDIVKMDWHYLEDAFPAFAAVTGIMMTYSITNGIGFSFVSYCFIMTCRGKAKQVKPLMWVVAVAFLVMFIMQ